MRRFRIWLVLILSGMITFMSGCPVQAADQNGEIAKLETFSRVYHLIQEQFVTPISSDTLIDRAIKGMVKSLDPYCALLTQKEMDLLESFSLGRYSGIGISVQKTGDEFVVSKVYRGSPAARAGILPGIILNSINGLSLKDLSEEQIAANVGGQPGSPVEIGCYRPDRPGEIVVYKLIRETIYTESVEFFEVNDSILVLQIHQFQKGTPDEIKRILSRKQYKAVIIDLRNNPGGLFLSAIETADIFLPPGPMIETRGQSGRPIDRYVSLNPELQKDCLIVVLINRYSASSAEVLAGVLKDAGKGTIVGEKSYGKGVMQTVFPVGHHFYLKLTTARFFLPSGTSFDKTGIQPDVPVPDESKIDRYQADDQLFQKALEIVNLKLMSQS